MGNCSCWKWNTHKKPVLSLDYDRLDDDYVYGGHEPVSYSQYVYTNKGSPLNHSPQVPSAPSAPDEPSPANPVEKATSPANPVACSL